MRGAKCAVAVRIPATDTGHTDTSHTDTRQPCGLGEHVTVMRKKQLEIWLINGFNPRTHNRFRQTSCAVHGPVICVS